MIKKLKELKTKRNSMLNEVIDNILLKVEDYNEIEEYIKEILEHGCISGIVPSMIYYSDTTEFYKRHKEKINNLLYDYMQDIGTYEIEKILKDWDTEDPLALYQYNQNLLSWFAFEETTFRIAQELNIIY